MNREELVHFLDAYLRIPEIKDYGPQGLQIEGRDEVRKIVCMVDSQQPCVEAALSQGADMLLVHHGIFWGPPQRLQGSYGQLVRLYMETNLNLYAAHLALDAHPEVGNNAVIAQRLGLSVEEWWGNANGVKLAALASAPEGTKFDYLVEQFEQSIGPVKVVQAHGPRHVQRVGILSGSGAGYIAEAASLGCDTFITGETSHAHFYEAQNANMNVLYAGHYTSETVGVQVLGQLLGDRFGVEYEFIDLPTGM